MPSRTPLSSLAFRLLVAGSQAEARLSAQLAAVDLKPKHVSLLSALKLGAPGSQAELAEVLHVAPSVVVALADHLEGLGAVARERDAVDRRRQRLTLTKEGRRLIEVSSAIADGVDAELRRHLRDGEATAVLGFLARTVSAAGIPLEQTPQDSP